MGRYTGLLYAMPSALEGVGRLVDFAGTLDEYNYSATPEEADRLATLADWWAVGEDMRAAIANVAQCNGVEIRDARQSR